MVTNNKALLSLLFYLPNLNKDSYTFHSDKDNQVYWEPITDLKAEEQTDISSDLKSRSSHKNTAICENWRRQLHLILTGAELDQFLIGWQTAGLYSLLLGKKGLH